jgi:hypothetical protein
MAQQPEHSLCRANSSWKNIKAAYRVLNSDKVSQNKILEPHIQRTVDRCSEEKILLAIQDTSYLNYTKRERTEGLGFIGLPRKVDFSAKGLIMHTTFAVSAAGDPLGILNQEVWARTSQRHHVTKTQRSQNRRLPIEKKESYKWIHSLYQVSFLPFSNEKLKIIHIADREADLYEFIKEILDLDGSMIIRAAQNRGIHKKKGRDCITEKLWPYMEKQPFVGQTVVEVLGSDHQLRQAHLKIAVGSFQLPPPLHLPRSKHGNDLKILSLKAVLIKEFHPPKGEKPVEWMLLTDLDVSNQKQLRDVIEWYTYRWNIELFHKVLKSGCRVEKCQLRTADRLQNFIAMMSVVAWRLFWLSRTSRVHPKLLCTEILTEHEWKLLFIQVHNGKALPSRAPTIEEVIIWIAKLGGYIGRNNDGPPGMISVWRGWMVLMQSEKTWRSIEAFNCG